MRGRAGRSGRARAPRTPAPEPPASFCTLHADVQNIVRALRNAQVLLARCRPRMPLVRAAPRRAAPRAARQIQLPSTACLWRPPPGRGLAPAAPRSRPRPPRARPLAARAGAAAGAGRGASPRPGGMPPAPLSCCIAFPGAPCCFPPQAATAAWGCVGRQRLGRIGQHRLCLARRFAGPYSPLNLLRRAPPPTRALTPPVSPPPRPPSAATLPPSHGRERPGPAPEGWCGARPMRRASPGHVTSDTASPPGTTHLRGFPPSRLPTFPPLHAHPSHLATFAPVPD